MIGHLFNRNADVYREVSVPDDRGGFETTQTVVIHGVPVRIPQPTDAERVLAQQAGAEHDTRAYFPANADIRRGDVVRAYDRTEWFRVVSVVSASTPGVYTRADVKRTQPRGEEP